MNRSKDTLSSDSGWLWSVAGFTAIFLLAVGTAVGGLTLGFKFLISLALLAPFLYLVVLLPLAFHELGHVIAARLSRVTVDSLSVGPIAWRRGVGIRWDKSEFATFATRSDYTVDPTDSRGKEMAILLGGPIGGFLLTAAYVGMLYAFGIAFHGFARTGDAFSYLVSMTIPIVALPAIMNLSPFSLPNEKSDMAKAIELWKSVSRLPVRLRSRPARVQPPVRDLAELNQALDRYYTYLDHDDFGRAAETIAIAEAAVGKIVPEGSAAAVQVRLEAAFMRAWWGADPWAAVETMRKIRSIPPELHEEELRVRVAVLKSAGEIDRARRLIEERAEALVELGGVLDAEESTHLQWLRDFVERPSPG